MSTLDFILCGAVVLLLALYIDNAIRLSNLSKDVTELEERERDLDKRIDNLVERFKLYDKSLEQLENKKK